MRTEWHGRGETQWLLHISHNKITGEGWKEKSSRWRTTCTRVNVIQSLMTSNNCQRRLFVRFDSATLPQRCCNGLGLSCPDAFCLVRFGNTQWIGALLHMQLHSWETFYLPEEGKKISVQSTSRPGRLSFCLLDQDHYLAAWLNPIIISKTRAITLYIVCVCIIKKNDRSELTLYSSFKKHFTAATG